MSPTAYFNNQWLRIDFLVKIPIQDQDPHLIVACGDTPEVFDAVEKAFNGITSFVRNYRLHSVVVEGRFHERLVVVAALRLARPAAHPDTSLDASLQARGTGTTEDTKTTNGHEFSCA